MSIYYLNNSGTNVYPYSNPNSGATNFNTLNTNVTFQDGDIIRFVASGGIIDDSGITVTNIDASISFIKYDDLIEDETNPNPVWEVGGSRISFSKINGEYEFNGIDVNISGAIVTSGIFYIPNNVESITVTNCKFIANNDITIYNNVIFQFGDGNDTNSATIENYTITNNTINNINFFSVIFREINNIEIANNTFVNSPNGDERIGYLFYLTFNNSNKIDMFNWNIYDNYVKSIKGFIYLSNQGSDTDGSIQDVNIYNNKVYDTQYGMAFISYGMKNVEIYNNVISIDSNTYIRSVIDSNTYISSVQDGIFFIVQTYDGITYDGINIYNNDISGYVNSIFMNDDAGCATVIKNITINENKIYDIYITSYVGIFQTLGENITITNNFIDASNSDISSLITMIGGNKEKVFNITITNNILISDSNRALLIYNNVDIMDNLNISYNNFINITSASDFVNIVPTTITLVTNFNFTNNIFYGENIISELYARNIDANTSTIDYNCYEVNPTIGFGNSITGALSTSGTNNIIADPRWIDFDNDDFYLKQDSPCINAGTLNSDIGAIPYVDGVNVYVQDSVITNFNNTTNETVVLRLENNALDNDTRDQFNIIKDNDNQFDFIPPINYPLLKDNIGYDEDLTWLINNKSELAPFPDVDSPPNPGKAYPQFTDYPYGIYGFRRSDGK